MLMLRDVFTHSVANAVAPRDAVVQVAQIYESRVAHRGAGASMAEFEQLQQQQQQSQRSLHRRQMQQLQLQMHSRSNSPAMPSTAAAASSSSPVDARVSAPTKARALKRVRSSTVPPFFVCYFFATHFALCLVGHSRRGRQEKEANCRER